MKRLLFFLVTALLALPLTALPFAVLNNIAALPWFLVRGFWFAFPPLWAFVAGALYGYFDLKKGGSIFGTALFFSVALYAANRYGMPFAEDLREIPLLIVSAVAALGGEVYGQFRSRRRKKGRSAGRAPLENIFQ